MTGMKSLFDSISASANELLTKIEGRRQGNLDIDAMAIAMKRRSMLRKSKELMNELQPHVEKVESNLLRAQTLQSRLRSEFPSQPKPGLSISSWFRHMKSKIWPTDELAELWGRFDHQGIPKERRTKMLEDTKHSQLCWNALETLYETFPGIAGCIRRLYNAMNDPGKRHAELEAGESVDTIDELLRLYDDILKKLSY